MPLERAGTRRSTLSGAGGAVVCFDSGPSINEGEGGGVGVDLFAWHLTPDGWSFFQEVGKLPGWP